LRHAGKIFKEEMDLKKKPPRGVVRPSIQLNRSAKRPAVAMKKGRGQTLRKKEPAGPLAKEE